MLFKTPSSLTLDMFSLTTVTAKHIVNQMCGFNETFPFLQVLPGVKSLLLTILLYCNENKNPQAL